MTASVQIVAYHGGRIDAADAGACVCIDVLRAATTAVTAAAGGVRCFPVASLRAAAERGRTLPGAVFAGEIHGRMPASFDLPNSPVAIRDVAPGTPAVLLSTSGTPLFVAAAEIRPTFIACLRNHRATAAAIARQRGNVVILGAASRGEFREEDQLCAARMAEAFLDSGYAAADAATVALVRKWRAQPLSSILQGRSARFLVESNQRADLDFVLTHVDDIDRPMIVIGPEAILADVDVQAAHEVGSASRT
jgi:2-phosphosulfolactate phosphatase